MKWGTFTHLIGLHGKAGSGKDTAFKYIRQWGEEEGRDVERDAFADRLKISAARALGYDGSELDAMNQLKLDGGKVMVWMPDTVNGGEYLSREITGREYLQNYGTEAHREVFDDAFWIKAVLNNERRYDLLVITDVRFANEAEAIREYDGEVWHIVRDGSGAGNHASEQPLDESLIDFTLDNNGTLDELAQRIYGYLDAVPEFVNEPS